MSEDRSAPVAVKAGDPIFLSVKAGMTVIVRHLPEVGFTSDDDRWWMADVIYVEGGARNPNVPTLFQVADVDSGEVLWVNADLVTHIVPGFSAGWVLRWRLWLCVTLGEGRLVVCPPVVHIELVGLAAGAAATGGLRPMRTLPHTIDNRLLKARSWL